MPAWATVVLTLGASAIAVLGTLAATRLQHHYARQERRDAEATALRKRGAAILGPISTLVADADPMRAGLNASPEMVERLSAAWDRWRGLRDELATYASAHPAPGVGVAAQRLTVAVSNALTSASWVVKDLVEREGWDRRKTLDAAQNDHARARELLELVRSGVRGEVTDRELVERTADIDGRHDEAHAAIEARE